MNYSVFQHRQYFKNKLKLGIGYSFVHDMSVHYTLVYDDAHIFVYKKTPTHSPEYTQEEYIGSDSFSGMLSLIDSSDVRESGIPDDIIAKTRIAITQNHILEIHYSYSFIDQDFTLYVYSEDLGYIESILDTSFDIPYIELIRGGISMYCLKLKIKNGSSQYTPSIVFTSKNVPDGTAYAVLRDSHFLAGGFGDIKLPPIIHRDDLFYTFEVAYNLNSHAIENFTLFYILRHKPHAKSAPL